MRVKPILFCCVLTLLLAGAALAAEPGPALAIPVFDEAASVPICSAAPVPQSAQPDLGGGPGTEASCPPSVWQACYQQHGTCALCFCLGSSCSCENRCM